jgi:3-deoxy-manno-octulosonate cytidylyltransferase (CMP-KDO synthetase)
MKALAIIPARYQSTRFPGKPLAMLGDKEMLKHVYDNVVKAGVFDKVVIATDDERVKNAALKWNANVVMTSEAHQSGTDRCAEVIQKLPESYDVIVNIQGDEPFINDKPLKTILEIFKQHPSVQIATLVQKFLNIEEIFSVGTAKVVRGTDGRAIYFSRSPIPFVRNAEKQDWMSHHTFWDHVGIYGYTPKALAEIVKLPVSLLEKAESLEQLRWIENGYVIHTAETDYRMISVDTPEDLERAEDFYRQNGTH